MEMFYVYSLRRNNVPVYVGCTSEKNLEIRKNRHLKKITNTKGDITGDEIFTIEECFDTESMAISYETALSCYYSFVGFNLFNKKFGNKLRPEFKIKGKGKGRVVSKKSKALMSESRKKLLEENSNLRDFLVSFSLDKRKKIYRSDGFVYSDSLSCKKSLKVSSKRFKEILQGKIEFKGYTYSQKDEF